MNNQKTYKVKSIHHIQITGQKKVKQILILMILAKIKSFIGDSKKKIFFQLCENRLHFPLE